MSVLIGQDREKIDFFSLNQLVDEDALVRLIDFYVDKIINSNPEIARELGFQYRGRPGYSKVMLLKIFIYGYFNNISSSRALMRECHINIELMWLTGNLEPNFRTFFEFRKKHLSLIYRVLKIFIASKFDEIIKNCDVRMTDVDTFFVEWADLDATERKAIIK